MDAVDEGDEEQGKRDESSRQQGKNTSFFGSSFFSSFRAKQDEATTTDEQRSSPDGKWKTLTKSRTIRFAPQRYSDLTNDEAHGIVATPMDADECKPMAPGARFLKNIQNEVEEGRPQFMRLRSNAEEGDDDHDGDEGLGREGGTINQMYRLQATRGGRDVGCCGKLLRFFSAIFNCGALTESSTEQNLYLGFGDPNRWLIHFFFWLFRKGWSTVIALSVVWYYMFVLFFALMIVLAAELDVDCVRIGGMRFGDLDNRSKFMDSFSLSWNTFSTVGYGSTYPALSEESMQSDKGHDGRCVFISFITSFEALVGVIFAGFIGAIFYAKVARITQRADVRFSDPLTVRFGLGVDTDLGVEDDEDKPQDEEGETKKAKEMIDMTPTEQNRTIAEKAAKPSPFPVITFRIANEMHDTLGGEIIGASVNAVVLIESTKYDDQVSEDLAKKISLDRMRRTTVRKEPAAKLRKTSSTTSLRNLDTSEDSERYSETTSEAMRTEVDIASSERSSKRGTDNAISYLQGLNSLAYKARFGKNKKMKIDEEEGGSGSKIVPRMVFTKLDLETSEHPLFKRIWRFKHIINPDSPLLTSEAQKAIMDNKGNWPREWNTHEAVRKAIRFNQMVVSFTGISNISGASVYKQKVYDYVDAVVGYQFVNALYRGRRGNLKVDLRLINDVAEQTGGGGEPLDVTSKGPLKR